MAGNLPSLLVLLLLLLSAVCAAATSPEIHEACKASRFPDSCERRISGSISSLPTAAGDIIVSIFNATIRSLPAAVSKVQAIVTVSSGDPKRTAAASSCLEVLFFSSRRLAAAAADPNLSSSADARSWTGAAHHYLSGCFSGLRNVRGTREVEDAMGLLAELANLTGDGLAMLAALQRYGSDTSLWGPPETERDGYWGYPPSSPTTVTSRDFPVRTAANATVCGDGGCEHGTVQAAVDAAPANVGGGERFVIWIREGVYDETVRVPFEKTNLVFLGDGMGKTVITGNLSVTSPGISTYASATVAVDGDGFMARDLTVRNTAGPDVHQAVAFRSTADLTVLDAVELVGHQDTLYAHSLRHFYKSCAISGTIDFIFGDAAAIFQDCTILVVPRQLYPEKMETDTITAHGRADPAQPTGFVFHRCTLNATEEYWRYYDSNTTAHKVYLGRPWREYSRTVFLNCYMAAVVTPEGWLPWDGEFGLPTLFYGEFQSSGPGANAPARVPWSSQIPAEHVAVYSVDNFIQGSRWIPSDCRR
ncbi:putative pectinesterase/pectinesterase inhibitor 51 [Apostasia shenzhenica]|uniref:Pectinesterase n=1 Tax=Apostasia shenzhenica TaxID=1088818 RepID=A0A2I0AM80_9ASPA|nr:putative pectinesterase/pectinesterase inhibitor 51 [Apostasia shenzhenica]